MLYLSNGNHSQYENVNRVRGGERGLWGLETFAGTSVSLSNCQEPQMKRETSALVWAALGGDASGLGLMLKAQQAQLLGAPALRVTAADSWVLHWAPLRDSLVRFKPVSPIYCTRSIFGAVAPEVLPYGGTLVVRRAKGLGQSRLHRLL